MILALLNDYYQRLQSNAEVDVAPPGFAETPIHFALVIDRDGGLVMCRDLRSHEGKKAKPRRLIVPTIKRSGAGFSSQFLWDNTGYVLGLDSKKAERAAKAFESFRSFHQRLGGTIEDEGMRALLAFLSRWNPECGPTGIVAWEEVDGSNVVFQLEGDTMRFLHDRPALRSAWINHFSSLDAPEGMCSLTGKTTRIARTHPDIKGVDGAQSKGAAIVSFNLASFESYGKEQNFNAPIGIEAASGYTTALNYLLRRDDNPQRRRLGDTTTVFWTKEKSPVESLFGYVLDPREDKGDDPSVAAFLSAVSKGKVPPDIDPNVEFYILGLSPNAARIAVRFWHMDTVGAVLQHIGQFYEQTAIVHAPWEPEILTVRQMLRDTAVLKKDDNIPHGLSGAMMRSFLSGARFPESLLPIVLERIRSEQSAKDGKGRAAPNVTYARASMIRGVLTRNYNQEATMSLNPENRDVGYVLGRLFAALEKVQQEALGKPNAGIRDRYYGSASATPRVVFPVLLRLAGHYVAKAEYGKSLDRKLAEIIDLLDGGDAGFPARLTLPQQGAFALGYYHQRQAQYPSNPKLEAVK
ncbi:MAG TPA: type I-C CRISPR-associated protein Cas8c/Csd1 [Kiritimatiellia bacterium]|nr:type I-C CRISPR-associated protein Cas8c/Csd1 [Kiritimatiellia bacterium]